MVMDCAGPYFWFIFSLHKEHVKWLAHHALFNAVNTSPSITCNETYHDYRPTSTHPAIIIITNSIYFILFSLSHHLYRLYCTRCGPLYLSLLLGRRSNCNSYAYNNSDGNIRRYFWLAWTWIDLLKRSLNFNVGTDCNDCMAGIGECSSGSEVTSFMQRTLTLKNSHN